METDVLGVVLAGGRSSRMGTDKAAIPFGGTVLVERAIAVLSSVFTDVVVAGASSVTPAVPVLRDELPGLGPLSGLDAAYGSAAGRAVFLLALDMPFVDASTVRAVLNPLPHATGANISVSDGAPQPLCAIYGCGLAAIVREHLESDDRSMARLIATLEGVRLVEIGAASAVNVNSERDLGDARRLLQQRDHNNHES